MKVIKRNGSEVDFDITKIIAAITKANDVVEESERMTPMQIRRGIGGSCLPEDEPFSFGGGDSGPGGEADHGARCL